MFRSSEYREQAEELVKLSAGLTDEQKMVAEYWLDGPNSEQPPGHWMRFAQWISERDHHTLDVLYHACERERGMPLDWLNVGAGAGIGALLGFGVNLFTNVTWDRLKSWRVKRENLIRITSPQPGQLLRDVKQLAPGKCFRVVGRLNTLPSDHKIWLIVQPHGQKCYWPQGFEPVQYTPATGDWFGYVFEPVGRVEIFIFAVVAPPSAHAFFEYYQRHGNATGWDPLHEIPAECTNRYQVGAETS